MQNKHGISRLMPPVHEAAHSNPTLTSWPPPADATGPHLRILTIHQLYAQVPPGKERQGRRSRRHVGWNSHTGLLGSTPTRRARYMYPAGETGQAEYQPLAYNAFQMRAARKAYPSGGAGSRNACRTCPTSTHLFSKPKEGAELPGRRSEPLPMFSTILREAQHQGLLQHMCMARRAQPAGMHSKSSTNSNAFHRPSRQVPWTALLAFGRRQQPHDVQRVRRLSPCSAPIHDPQ